MGVMKSLSMGSGRRGGRSSVVSMVVDAKQEAELLRKLNGLGNRVFRKVVSGAANAAMTPVLKTARKLVPVGEGKLAASLIKKRKTYSKTQTVWVGVGAAKGRAPHAHLVEFGHMLYASGDVWKDVHGAVAKDKFFRNGGRRGKFLGFVPPRPFLRPAFDQNQPLVMQKYREKLAKGVEREALKNA
jgi:HK97 gp10 family phage protein